MIVRLPCDHGYQTATCAHHRELLVHIHVQPVHARTYCDYMPIICIRIVYRSLNSKESFVRVEIVDLVSFPRLHEWIVINVFATWDRIWNIADAVAVCVGACVVGVIVAFHAIVPCVDATIMSDITASVVCVVPCVVCKTVVVDRAVDRNIQMYTIPSV